MQKQTLRTLAHLPRGTVLAVGTFDGVHIGHQALLGAMFAFANATRAPASVLTFEGSPRAFLAPDAAPGLLVPPHIQEGLLRQFTWENAHLIRLPFNDELAKLSAEAFAAILKDRRMTIFCGEDWRFGKDAQGSPETLRAAGVDVCVVPYAKNYGKRISSSRIRDCLAQGNIQRATDLLGYPWYFSGIVVHGRRLAKKTFGVPTLNVPYVGGNGERMAPLARGVYHGYAVLENNKSDYLPALINFGTAPSVKSEPEPLFEVHLVGHDGNFYGKKVAIMPRGKLIRPEKKFATLEALKRQIHADLDHFMGEY